jgi:hypothetical protein
MASVFRLSTAQVQRLIRERARDSAQVGFTQHVLVRMKQRRILRPEVLDVLRLGLIERPPEPNAQRGSLECRVQRFVAGRELGVVVALSDDSPMLVVVTAIVIGEGK